MPSSDAPYYKHFIATFLTTIEFVFKFTIPCTLGIIFVAFLFLCVGRMLGFVKTNESNEIPNSQEGQAGSPDPAQAIDEKTRLRIEMQILEEMLKTRRERTEKLGRSN
ncbi:hypothetical protein EYZ11_005226 [Aspergillus tanneri]|nr:hypothetical protein EYZ11_005226 [Aspergillus tanneri]